jgi:hypothetical protein
VSHRARAGTVAGTVALSDHPVWLLHSAPETRQIIATTEQFESFLAPADDEKGRLVRAVAWQLFMLLERYGRPGVEVLAAG